MALDVREANGAVPSG